MQSGLAYIAQVGDSRAYLLRDELQQLTEDHTLVQRMVREGKLTPEEAGHHPQRSVLTRAVGVEDGLDVDDLTLDVHSGDRILLCTDGLTSMVENDAIERILKDEPDPQSAAEQLVSLANEAGGEDNITVVVVDFEQGDGASGAADGVTVASSPSAVGVFGEEGNGSAGPRTGAAAVGTTSVEEPPRPAPIPPKRRRRWIWWVSAIALVLILAVIGTRLYIDRQWYVGESEGRVAIFNGIPTKILGIRLAHVAETTELSASRAEQLQPWQDLRDGITANNLHDAEGIVTQIRADLASSPSRGTP